MTGNFTEGGPVPVLQRLVVILSALGAVAWGAPQYHITQKLKLAGDTGWDFLTADSEAKRLYITRGDHVSVVRMDTGEAIGEIPADGAHGVALAPDLRKGFSTNGRANTVTEFSLENLKVEKSIPTGQKPDAILYEPKSHRILAFNGGSHSVTVIDAAKGEVVATIALSGKPESAAAGASGRVFVNLEDKNQIALLDPVKAAQLATWNLTGCESPSGLAIDAPHERLFAGCENQRLVVVAADSGRVLATLPIGKGVDATAFDPGTQLAFSSNGEGTLTVIQEESPDRFQVLANVATQPSARTLAVDEKTHQVYLVAASHDPKKKSGPPGHQRPQIVPGSVTLLVLAP
jgi:YVTN family beta-propeller protein